MAESKLVVGFIITIIIVGMAAWYAGSQTAAPATSTRLPPSVTTVTTTVTETAGAGATVTTTITVTETPTTTGAPSAWTPPKKIRAAWVYVGPIGDFGWTYQHDVGRRVVQAIFKDWLETTYVESVSEAKLKEVIETLIAKGYNVIFTSSFEFMDGTLEEAKKHPDLLFFHCSGYKRLKNMGTYFADLVQVYYLNGLMAGALTKTGHIGYVASFTIPEVVRHINAFAIGAKEVGEQLGKDIKVYVIEIGAWFAPDKAREAARTLVERYNCDVLAFTEDSTAIIQFAQTWTQQHPDHPVYVFSHYSPGYAYGPDVVVSGQLVRWEVIYADILSKIHAGILTPNNLDKLDYWYLLDSGAVDLACHMSLDGSIMHINPKFVPVLKNIKIKDKVTGSDTNVYDLVMSRYYQMKDAPMLTPLEAVEPHKYENLTVINIAEESGKEEKYMIALFHVFTGPLDGYMKDDPSKKVHIPEGVVLGHDELWTMQWFVDWVVYLGRG
ncbi:MAG: BMP family ABC transporter substrate-binding protein [Desulfurococcales archaeon]|nr:BMP family ABC transporter substrate-binding protein [Desulfurococcales archaeon]